jgi:subtilase family serine protease
VILLKKSKFCTLLTALCLSLTVVVSAGFSASGSTRVIPGGTNGEVSKAKPLFSLKNFTSTSSPSGYSPAQIKQAYGFSGSTATGKGKTIALIVAYGDPNLQSDISTFDSQYGLTAANMTIKDMGVTKSDASWALEAAMDVEWAHALAPDANLLVVNAVSDDSDNLLAAVDYAVSAGADVVSMSWGSTESAGISQYDSHFSSSKTVFVAASGDDGAGAIWPSSSPNVISVGGTTLNLDASGTVLSETAWKSSGGGLSKIEAEPSWQSNFGISTYYRVDPDVSFDADKNTGASVYCSVSQSGQTGWFTVGGTSLGSPCWAAIVADVNESATSIKNPGALYALAGGTGYTNSSNCFADITSGSNGYSAQKGYDAVTGLGSPQVSNLITQAVANASSLSSITNTNTTTINTIGSGNGSGNGSRYARNPRGRSPGGYGYGGFRYGGFWFGGFSAKK